MEEYRQPGRRSSARVYYGVRLPEPSERGRAGGPASEAKAGVSFGLSKAHIGRIGRSDAEKEERDRDIDGEWLAGGYDICREDRAAFAEKAARRGVLAYFHRLIEGPSRPDEYYVEAWEGGHSVRFGVTDFHHRQMGPKAPGESQIGDMVLHYRQVKGSAEFFGGRRNEVRSCGGGRRGAVKEMSRASRRRLVQRLGQIDARIEVPKMLTLTYPGSWSCDGRKWKRDLKAFRKRWEVKYGQGYGVWVLEPQGRGAPHFHLILWGVEWVDIPWVKLAWYEVVGSGLPAHLVAGIKVEQVRSWRGVSSYVAAYLGKKKHEVPESWEHQGRFWGEWNKDASPMRKVFRRVTHRGWLVFRRLAFRYLAKHVKRRWWVKSLKKGRDLGERYQLWALLPWDITSRVLEWCSAEEYWRGNESGAVLRESIPV